MITAQSFNRNKCLPSRAFDQGWKGKLAPPPLPAGSGIHLRREPNPIPPQPEPWALSLCSYLRVLVWRGSSTKKSPLRETIREGRIQVIHFKMLDLYRRQALLPLLRFSSRSARAGQSNLAHLSGRSQNETSGRCITPWKSAASLTPSVE
jgi:hypothetical protein